MSFAPTCINQTVLFLTRPLALIRHASLLLPIQNILTTTLHATYIPTEKLVLSLSLDALPPRPIYAACIAAGINWPEWMEVLGGKEMDIFVLPSSVIVKCQGREFTLWKATAADLHAPLTIRRGISPDQSTVPISKFALKANATPLPVSKPAAPVRDLKTTLTNGITRRRTLAQVILESDTEAENEIFSLLNKGCIISPTPTCASFPTSISGPSNDDSDSSRPSSRSSLFSSRSHSSNDSMSSIASIQPPSLKITPPSPAIAPAPRVFIAPRRQRPAPVPAPAPVAAAPQEKIYVDTSRKQVQAYLYEGGKSTVLTGGVMLGAPSSGTKPSQGKYRAPVRRANESWRRAVVARI